jgi:hypothetical protein
MEFAGAANRATLVLATLVGCGRIAFDDVPPLDAIRTIEVTLGENSGDTITGVTSDARLREQVPMDGQGGCDQLRTEFVGTTLNTVVIRFDVSQLPANPVVGAAVELVITSATDANFGDGAVRAFRLTEAWVEGTSCMAPGATNWNERAPGVPWSTPGAIGPPTIDPELLARREGPVAHEERFSLDLPPALIESWIATPAENHGLALLGENDDSAIMYARNSVSADGKRPRLRITQQAD